MKKDGGPDLSDFFPVSILWVPLDKSEGSVKDIVILGGA